MYLIKNMLKRGLSLQDIIEKIEKREISLKVEDIKKRFEKEKEIVKEDEQFLELFKMLQTQERVTGEEFKFYREYILNERDNRKAYLPIIHMNSNIKENDFILIFLCNRMKRLKGIEFEEYNMEFLKSKAKIVQKKIKKHEEEFKPLIKTEIKEFFEKETPNKLKSTTNISKKEADLETKKEKKKDEETDVQDNDISEIIKNMKQKAKEYKEKHGMEI